jgi:SAM-dependent methyltransferase
MTDNSQLLPDRKKDIRFAFGRNWQRFIKRYFSPARLEEAREQLLNLLGLPSLAGLEFLDIGSGSGLHSLAALGAGAAKVISFDYDPPSGSRRPGRQYAGNPDNWTVTQARY